MSKNYRRLLTATAGITIGCLLLWLAVRDVDLETIASLAASVQLRWVAVGAGFYMVSLVIRTLRWHVLLHQLSSVSRRKVAEVLVVGFAINYTLPARLGELFRADYAKRRLGVSRSAALGSIVVERLADGVTVVLFLSIGLFTLNYTLFLPGDGDFWLLQVASILGALLFMAIAGGTVLLVRFGAGRQNLTAPVARRVDDLTRGLRTFHRGSFVRIITLSPLIWALEGMALWCILRATGVQFDLIQTMILVGAATLSTLIPTAPGFLGSYQLVYAIILSSFGFSEASGIVAATLMQLFLFGSVTLIGLSIYVFSGVHGAVTTIRRSQE